MRFNQVMSERRKNTMMEYDTQVDVISKRNSEPIYSPKSYRSQAYSQTKSFQSAKEHLNHKISIDKPIFNDNLYQSYIKNKAKKIQDEEI